MGKIKIGNGKYKTVRGPNTTFGVGMGDNIKLIISVKTLSPGRKSLSLHELGTETI